MGKIWGRIKCRIGIHDWMTIRSAIGNISACGLFVGYVDKVKARMSIQVCQRCNDKRGYVETAIQNQVYPVWEIEEGMNKAGISQFHTEGV